MLIIFCIFLKYEKTEIWIFYRWDNSSFWTASMGAVKFELSENGKIEFLGSL